MLLPRASAQLWRHSLALLQSTASTQTCAGRRELRPLHTLPCRQHLSRHARGVKRWEEVAQSRAEVNRQQQEEEEEKAGMDFDAVCNGMIENLKINRYARASNLTKIFDHVTTLEELNLAGKTLTSFRRSWGQPTRALPLVVVRACLRVGPPKKALHYVRNKVQYGVFPTRRVYHVLLDAFIREGDAAGALAVYDQMLSDEVVPDGMTFHLVSRAHVMMGTPDGLEAAVSLSKQCYELEPKLGSKSLIIVIKTLLDQGRSEEALAVLTELEREQLLLLQTHLNLLTHTLVAVGELGRILAVLKEKLCIPNQETTVPVQKDSVQDQQLGLPREAWPKLCTTVQDSGDAELIKQLESLSDELKVKGRLAFN